MAHFAELNENKIVQQVIVVDNQNILDENGNESEEVGINFLEGLFGHRNWKQTSYNSNFRKNYAGKGYRYYDDVDGFCPPQPFPSWTLNKQNLTWQPPIPRPEPKNQVTFVWDEENLEWKEIRIPMN